MKARSLMKVLAAGCALLLGGCHSAAHYAAQEEASFATAELASDVQAPARPKAQAPNAADVQLAAATTPQLDRYLIKTAHVSLETEDAAAGLHTLTEAAVSRGGYVATLNESVDNLGRRNVVIELRLPAAQLEAALLQLDALGRVMSKSVSTQDVTEEYVDTDASMRNLKRTEERILDHLNRMGTLEDILKVEAELSRVRQQIEQLEGRLRFLDQRVSFSSIHCTLIEAPKAGPVSPPETFSTAEEFTEALRSLVAVLQVAWTAIIWLGVWSPVWLSVLVPVIWLARRGMRVRVVTGNGL